MQLFFTCFDGFKTHIYSHFFDKEKPLHEKTNTKPRHKHSDSHQSDDYQTLSKEGIMSRGDFIHLAKKGRGDFILVVKNMGGIISTFTKMTRGDSIRGDFVRIPAIDASIFMLENEI